MERKNNSFLITGDTPRDIEIPQSESKMKACLGQKVKISLPKAYQTANPRKSLVVKGVPAEVTELEFKKFLDLNKINYAEAERLTSSPNKDKSSQNSPIAKDHMLHPTIGPHVAYKKQAFRQHVVVSQKSYASMLRQNSAPHNHRISHSLFRPNNL